VDGKITGAFELHDRLVLKLEMERSLGVTPDKVKNWQW
jgi:hypothetical protein